MARQSDALNNVAYHDDQQIVDGRTVKRRRRKGEMVGAFVRIEVKND
jgi:Holliday junction resolvase RusA-like endonuclease